MMKQSHGWKNKSKISNRNKDCLLSCPVDFKNLPTSKTCPLQKPNPAHKKRRIAPWGSHLRGQRRQLRLSSALDFTLAAIVGFERRIISGRKPLWSMAKKPVRLPCRPKDGSFLSCKPLQHLCGWAVKHQGMTIICRAQHKQLHHNCGRA